MDEVEITFMVSSRGSVHSSTSVHCSLLLLAPPLLFSSDCIVCRSNLIPPLPSAVGIMPKSTSSLAGRLKIHCTFKQSSSAKMVRSSRPGVVTKAKPPLEPNPHGKIKAEDPNETSGLLLLLVLAVGMIVSAAANAGVEANGPSHEAPTGPKETIRSSGVSSRSTQHLVNRRRLFLDDSNFHVSSSFSSSSSSSLGATILTEALLLLLLLFSSGGGAYNASSSLTKISSSSPLVGLSWSSSSANGLGASPSSWLSSSMG
mmetsp:Transcript_22179/g.48098  ORF Transcript_22179/g.48098 Transcript_22179/m.48098 type:complete len:259 (+) Transcript_22179:3111-3887(+)